MLNCRKKSEMENAVQMFETSDERDLLADFKNGDRGAFETLYVLHRRRVFSIAVNYFGGDRERAGDVVQQVFLKLFRNPSGFRGEAEFTTWIYRVTINACIDEHRKSRRFLGLDDFLGLADRRIRHDERFQQLQVSEQVRKAIATLKPEYRSLLVLKYSEGLSYQEIAEVLNISIGTVSSRLNRGHTMLARKLAHLKDKQ